MPEESLQPVQVEPVTDTSSVVEDELLPEGEALSEDEAPLTQAELDEARATEAPFSWQASEYVHNRKGPGWYATLAAVLVILVLLAVWLHFWLEIGAFLAMGAAVIVYASKPPRTLTYELTPTGIAIEGRDFPFTQFRSFGVLPNEEWHTIDLDPVKRFSPRITLLFRDEDFEAIVGHLELHLPRADRDPDLVERVTRYLRF